MPPLLIIALGIGLASALGFAARLLRQPPLVGYILAGFLLSVFGLLTGPDSRTLYESMSVLGITFLLFLVGLELNLQELKVLGRVITIAGVSQIILTLTLAFLLSMVLGFTRIESTYIGLSLTFCSTIIIVKLLSEKRDLASLYGKIAVGVLLIQDLAAIVILVFLSGFKAGTVPSPETLLLVLGKAIAVFSAVWLLAKFVLTRIFDKVASSGGELLFVFSIAWVLLVSALVSIPAVGFSPAMGGFLAGLALANSTGHLQIASRVKPLRDFFITIFFLLLGTKLVMGLTPQIIFPAIILSLFVVFINTLIVLVLMALLGHKKRTSFLVAVSFSQISEFSLILVSLGQNLGHIGNSIVGLVTLVAVITMAISTYLILNGYALYQKMASALSFFERKKVREKALELNVEFDNHIVLLGCDRTGRELLPTLKKMEEDVVIVDFNPTVVSHLVADGFTAYYGDIADHDTLVALGLERAKMIISTTGSTEDNLIFLELIAGIHNKPITIITAGSPRDALKLYEAGASYVVVPQTVGGEHLSNLIASHGLEKEYYSKLRDRSFDRLAKDRFLI